MKTKTKECARCLETKPLTAFGDNPATKTGKKSYCRPCAAVLQKIWRREHPRRPS